MMRDETIQSVSTITNGNVGNIYESSTTDLLPLPAPPNLHPKQLISITIRQLELLRQHVSRISTPSYIICMRNGPYLI